MHPRGWKTDHQLFFSARPDRQGTSGGNCRDQPSIWREVSRGDGAFGVQVPQCRDSPIQIRGPQLSHLTTGKKKLPAVGREFQIVVVDACSEAGDFLAAIEIPQSHGGVGPGRGHRFPVGIQRTTLDPTLVAPQHPESPSGAPIPDDHCLVMAARGHQLAVRTEAARGDLVRVARQHSHYPAGGRLPHPQRVVPARRDQMPPAWTESATAHQTLVASEGADQSL